MATGPKVPSQLFVTTGTSSGPAHYTESMKETKERLISIQHFCSDIVEPGYVRVANRIRPKVDATVFSPEVNVLCGLNLRITRLAIACRLVSAKGLEVEALILLRSGAEALVNLAYIFHSGPRREGEKSTRDLCLQFIAYAEVAYKKLIESKPERVREVFKRRKNMSDQEYDALHETHLELARRATDDHGCRSERWHPMNLKDMAQKVLDDPPPFIDQEFCQPILSSFVSANGAVHVDALSMRTHYADHGEGLLELVFDKEVIWGDVLSTLAFSSWKAVADFLNEREWLNQMLDEELSRVLKERFDSAVPVKRTVLLPPWLEE